MNDRYTMTLSCGDHPGIVASITTILYQFGGNIIEAQQVDDQLTNTFFMRIRFAFVGADRLADMRPALDTAAAIHGLDYALEPDGRVRRVVILVSRFDHCLADLLYRQTIGELAMDIVAIVSNHPREAFAHLNLGAIPFHYFPVEKGRKPEQEALIRAVVEDTRAELVVLARYMQILSDEMATFLGGRCINIHHSFLPGFKGAKPYHQAHRRGVKLIGATAHFVTADLDEGPIIEQDVERVSHRDTPDDLVRKGRDIERQVLSRAVRSWLDMRVMLNGSTTIVFD